MSSENSPDADLFGLIPDRAKARQPPHGVQHYEVVGHGMRGIQMLQFLKGSWHYGELESTQAFGQNFGPTDGPWIRERWRRN